MAINTGPMFVYRKIHSNDIARSNGVIYPIGELVRVTGHELRACGSAHGGGVARYLNFDEYFL